MFRLATIYAISAVAYDLIAALIARAFSINFGNFAIFCIILFIGAGIYAGRTLPPRRAVVAIVIAAIAEATLGWYVAAIIGPARPTSNVSWSSIVFLAIVGIAIDTAAGLLGVMFGARAARHRS